MNYIYIWITFICITLLCVSYFSFKNFNKVRTVNKQYNLDVKNSEFCFDVFYVTTYLVIPENFNGVQGSEFFSCNSHHSHEISIEI
jgi:hypothetical protein